MTAKIDSLAKNAPAAIKAPATASATTRLATAGKVKYAGKDTKEKTAEAAKIVTKTKAAKASAKSNERKSGEATLTGKTSAKASAKASAKTGTKASSEASSETRTAGRISGSLRDAEKEISASTSTEAAPATVAAITKGYDMMNDTTKKIAAEAKDRFDTLVSDFNGHTKEAMEKSGKITEEAVAFQKANIEALVESSKVAATNMETLGQEIADFSRQSIEDATAALKDYTSVKSPVEFFQLYSENSRKAFDTAVAHGSKTSELFVKLANDSLAPLSGRVSQVTAKIKASA